MVRRLILLALGLAALLSTAAPRTASIPPAGTVSASAVEFCLMPGQSHAPFDSDQHWRPHHHTIATVTESVWKSALVHAEFAATPSARVFDPARLPGSPDPPVDSEPHYLRHTPLLI
jgi:hypothetical protein